MAERAWAGLGGQSLSEGGPRLLTANQGLTNPNLMNGQTNNNNKVDRMSVHYMDKIPEKFPAFVFPILGYCLFFLLLIETWT